MPDHGIGYSALKYASAPGDEVPACLRRHRLPAISFNYLGAFNEQADDALWALIDQTADLENGAMPVSGNVLDLVLYVHDDRLSIVMSGLLPHETLSRIGSHYVDSLSALVEHCCHEAGNGVCLASPGDFPMPTSASPNGSLAAKASPRRRFRSHGNPARVDVFQPTQPRVSDRSGGLRSRGRCSRRC